ADSHAEHDRRAQPEAHVVAELREVLRERWPAELDEHLGRARRHALAGADEERHALPPPGVDLQAHGRERLDLRVGGDPGLLSIAAELAAHEILGLERR